MSLINTPLTELLNIKHPVMLAGMNVAAGSKWVDLSLQDLQNSHVNGATDSLQLSQTLAVSASSVVSLSVTPDKTTLLAIYRTRIHAQEPPAPNRRVEGRPQRQECTLWYRLAPSSSRRVGKENKLRLYQGPAAGVARRHYQKQSQSFCMRCRRATQICS